MPATSAIRNDRVGLGAALLALLAALLWGGAFLPETALTRARAPGYSLSFKDVFKRV